MTTDSATDTLSWYNTHAVEFAAQTSHVDLSSLYDKFLRYVGSRGRILDAGCGAGRDTTAFLARGYEVVAFDASEELVRLARSRIDHRAPVNCMRFEDVTWKAEFDGIWACASLLHVPLASFTDVVSRLAGALRPGGVFYMSFKLGEGERVSAKRLFVNYTADSLARSLRPTPLVLVETWVSDDVRPERHREQWLNAIATPTKAGREATQPLPPKLS